MGIRYYGWSISRDEVIEAKTDPWPVIRRADQRHDLPDWTNTDFDKAWPLLQRLFSPDWPRSRRPGYELVAGNVTYPDTARLGYLPHIGVLDPVRVLAVAEDVASVGPEDVRELSAGLCYDDESRREVERDYLAYYLGEAQSFTADAAARGHGILYSIG